MRNNFLTIFLLLGAIVAGVGGYFMTEQFISEEITDYKTKIDSGMQLVDVVVASAPLKAGDRITNNTVSIRPMPREFLHKDFVAPNQFGSIANAQLAFPLSPGEAVLPSHLVSGSMNSFSDLIGKDQRAVTINVNSQDTVDGFLEPGDFVDLMITLQDGAYLRTVPLLNGVKVIATGRSLEGDIEIEANYRQITMGVGPKDAAKILHAQNVGTIRVLLRGDGSGSELAGDDYITIENLVDSKQKEARRKKSRATDEEPQGFRVIRAGRS